MTDIHTDTKEIYLNSIFIGYISLAINMYGRADFIYRKLSQIQNKSQKAVQKQLVSTYQIERLKFKNLTPTEQYIKTSDDMCQFSPPWHMY